MSFGIVCRGILKLYETETECMPRDIQRETVSQNRAANFREEILQGCCEFTLLPDYRFVLDVFLF